MARNAAGEAVVINVSSLNIPEDTQRMKTDLLKKHSSTYQKRCESSTDFAHISTLHFPRRWGWWGSGVRGVGSGLFICCPLGKHLFTLNSRINSFLSCPSYQVQASPHWNQLFHLHSSEVITAENATAALDSSNICPLQASWERYWRSQWDGTVDF